jgi:uroporphyrinogen decarboxylase
VNSRERILVAVNHQEPDRVPIDLGATIISSITKPIRLALKEYLRLPQSGIIILDHKILRDGYHKIQAIDQEVLCLRR